MKIMWLSNAPWADTGYGNQTRVFTPRIKKLGHDISITAFYGHDGRPIDWGGIKVYGKGFAAFGGDIIEAHTHHSKADIMISLMDAWVLNPEAFPVTRWCPWFPIDQEPLPRAVSEPVSKAFARIVFSKFGARMMDNAGLDYEYVPHGVETDVFKPLDRERSREICKLPKDRYIIGMVAANKGNPPRKAFFQNIAAFAELHKKHPDALLYLHTMDGERGGHEAVNLKEYCELLGLKVVYAPDYDGNVIFANQYTLALGYPDEFMAALYNAFDVHLLVSMGEGFGIPILEAQACGCPVIVGDWTSMSELCFSGWKVRKSEAEKFYTPLAGYQYLPHTNAILDRLSQAYLMQGNQDYRNIARAGALAYDADKVAEKYWKPALERIAAKVASHE